MQHITRNTLLALLALILLLIPVMAQDDDANQDNNETLTIGINAEMGGMDPHHQAGAIVNNRFNYMIFDSLTTTDTDNNVVPMLATAWEATDDTTWVFTLREGVVFHDGSIMTAEDVAFSLNRLLFGENESFIRSSYAPYITSVEATGDLQVTITTPSTDPLLPLRLASSNAAIMPQAYVEANSFEDLQLEGIGAGPYKLVEWVQGESMTLEAHADYWMGAPDAETVIMRIIPETSTRVAALQSGEVDFITTISPDLVDSLGAAEGIAVDAAPVLNFMLVYFNTTEGLTADANIRKALSLAIDRAALADDLWGGRVRVMNDYYLPSEFGYSEDVNYFEYDPQRAMQLLQEAGYNDEPIAFTPPNAYYTNGQLVTDVINEMWKAVGFNVEYEPLDTAAWAERSLAGNNIATLQSFGTNGDPATGSIVQTWDSWMGNYFQPSEEARELAAEAGASLDVELRQENYRQIADLMDEATPIAPLYQTVEFYGRAENIEWTPHQNFYINLRPGAFEIN